MASFLLNFNDVKCLRNSSTTIEVLNNNVVVYDLIFVKLMDQQNREIAFPTYGYSTCDAMTETT